MTKPKDKVTLQDIQDASERLKRLFVAPASRRRFYGLRKFQKTPAGRRRHKTIDAH